MNDLIEKLSDLRSQFNCFDKNERDAYHTLSEAIKVLSERPEPCEDTVSRADVEIEIANLLKRVFVEYEDIAKKAAARLQSVTPKEQRWIPCVDGNEPKANTDCWISTNAKYVRRASYASKTNNQPNGFIVTVCGLRFYEYGKFAKVWMPYEEPEPYRPKETEL